MIVNSKEEFDNAISAATGLETIIDLPGGTINWKLNVGSVCTINGNQTLIDVSETTENAAIEITADAQISNVSIINSTGDGVIINRCAPLLSEIFAQCENAYKFDNVNGGQYESLDASNATVGFKLLNTRNTSFERCDAHNCTTGYDLIGSNSIVGDIFFQDLGLNVEPGQPTGLSAETYYFMINDEEYHFTASATSSYASLVGLMMNATNGSGGKVSDSYLGLFFNNNVRIINRNSAPIALAGGVSGTDLFVSLLDFGALSPSSSELATERTDRTHHNVFASCFAFENQTGIRLINADNNEFDDCSKSYENTNTGILQQPASYSNSFAGELFGNQNYGARNTDTAGGVHDLDASGAWWGHTTGPSGQGPGQGDRVSLHVIYEPWGREGTEPDLPYPETRDWMWRMLGNPLVRVELTEQQITDDILVAIDKYLYYHDPEPYYAYFDLSPGQQEVMLPIEIGKKRIMEVVYQPHSDLFSQLSGSGESFFLTYYLQSTGGTFLSDFYIAMAYKETFERTLGIQPSWEFLTHPQDESKPYHPITNPYRDFVRVYPKPSINSIKLGLKVSRVLTEEEVDNTMWIRKYALTWAKEQLAKVRGKFGSVPGPTGEIQLQGSELMAEAQQDRESLVRDLIGRGEPLGFIMG